jgi:hypothetical protein
VNHLLFGLRYGLLAFLIVTGCSVLFLGVSAVQVFLVIAIPGAILTLILAMLLSLFGSDDEPNPHGEEKESSG